MHAAESRPPKKNNRRRRYDEARSPQPRSPRSSFRRPSQQLEQPRPRSRAPRTDRSGPGHGAPPCSGPSRAARTGGQRVAAGRRRPVPTPGGPRLDRRLHRADQAVQRVRHHTAANHRGDRRPARRWRPGLARHLTEADDRRVAGRHHRAVTRFTDKLAERIAADHRPPTTGRDQRRHQRKPDPQRLPLLRGQGHRPLPARRSRPPRRAHGHHRPRRQRPRRPGVGRPLHGLRRRRDRTPDHQRPRRADPSGPRPRDQGRRRDHPAHEGRPLPRLQRAG
ncbi:hypothetical protein GA0115255_1231012 [Streptomyces sp. Ncost-T6T-2b]|nr:hypothetical protein GA0115255_1231012 [Streptomyces sp. Ncost-T6T-2b]